MKRERPFLLKTLSASLASGVLVFLLLYAFELVLTYWLGKKLHLTRFVYYSCAYLVVGAVFGCGIGLSRAFLTRFAVRRPEQAERLFVSLNLSGLVYFLALIVLNARLLPYSPVMSAKSLPVNIALIGFCAALFSLSYLSARGTLPFNFYRAGGACVSVAAALAVFHAFIPRSIGESEPTLSATVWLMFSFAGLGSLVGLADVGLAGMIAGRGEDGVRQARVKRLFVGKAVFVVSLLLLVMFVKRYTPLLSERAGPSAEAAGKPNIIILMLDTVRQDRLSTYGCERATSPNIDRFAEQSRVFDAYSTSPWTLPSHASLVTGLYPTECGTGPEIEYHIDARNRTLAEILRENGYGAAAVISNYPMLGHSSGFPQGFDYYYAKPRETELAFPLFVSYLIKKFLPDSSALVILPCERAEYISAEAIRYVTEQAREPFFLFLNYMDAHAPYMPPHPYNLRWQRERPEKTFLVDDGNWVRSAKHLDPGERELLEAEGAHLLGRYDGEIRYLDEQVGFFLDKLKDLGAFDDSLIILTSDHGEFFTEHLLFEHPGPPYQEVIRVPLIVKPPADEGAAPARIPGSYSLVDLFHSILEYADIPHEPQHEPRGARRSLFDGPSSPVFSEFHLTRPEDSRDAARYGAHIYSLVRSDYKLIYSSNDIYEFYDLSQDPRETRNLTRKDLPGEVTEMYERMRLELSSQIEAVNARKLVPAQLPPEKMNQIREDLKTLGYVQ